MKLVVVQSNFRVLLVPNYLVFQIIVMEYREGSWQVGCRISCNVHRILLMCFRTMYIDLI